MAVADSSASLSKEICEIRVPTYRRPKLLRRALQSIISQSYADWQCLVFDDCPAGSAREVVEGLGEQRIQYRQNPRSLGAIGNIDQCFRNQPLAGGSYACVVEDDNYLLPEHLETQFAQCREHRVDVTFAPQFCEAVKAKGEVGELTESKTLTWIYSSGLHHFREILPALLFSHAFSNGAAFWRIGSAVDFELGPLTKNPGIQETARILRIRCDVYIGEKATAVWRSNDPIDSYVESKNSGYAARLRRRWSYYLERREAIALRTFYLRKYGLSDIVKFKDRFDSAHLDQMERSLLICGRYVVLTKRSFWWRTLQIFKGALIKLLIPNHIDLRGAKFE